MTERSVYGPSHIERRHDLPSEDVTMTDAQFAELKALLTELLTPGYELSKLVLAQYQAQAEAQAKAAAEAQAEAQKAPPEPPAPPAA